MSNNSLIYITLCILLQLLVVKSQTNFKPDLRWAHTATFINNKLYILGGANPVQNAFPKEKFLYIDFSLPFNTNELKWNDLSSTANIVPPHHYATAVRGGANNDTLFLYGGINGATVSYNEGGPMALVYIYDTQSNSWKIPEITGVPPTGKIDMTAITDYNGLIYLFGGYSTGFVNDMFILNSINLSCKQVSSINAPSPRNEYGVVFLPNKNIIYMGT
jgi:N-acetylneuraminic acid mutarotase